MRIAETIAAAALAAGMMSSTAFAQAQQDGLVNVNVEGKPSRTGW